MSKTEVVVAADDKVAVVEGFVVARVRDGRCETVGSLVPTHGEAEAKREIAQRTLSAGPAWTVQRAVLVLPEVLG